MDETNDPTAALRALMGEDDDQVIGVMEKVKRVHVSTPRDATAAKHFRRLMRNVCMRRDHECPHDRRNRLEGNLMVVLGPSGAGKSTLLRNCFVESGLCPGYDQLGPWCPVISVEAPSPCGSKELAIAVLERTGLELARNVDGPEAWRHVRHRLRSLGVHILNINEMQHVPQSANAKVQGEVRNALKALMVDPGHPVGLVISGMPETRIFLCPEDERRRTADPDIQVPRRGSWMSVDPLVMPVDNGLVKATVEELAEVAGLTVEGDFEQRLMPRLMHAGCYLLGITITEIHNAIEQAVEPAKDGPPDRAAAAIPASRESPMLTLDHFADAFAARTGNLPRWNPYLADDYRRIDASQVLVRGEPVPPDPRDGRRGRPPGARS